MKTIALALEHFSRFAGGAESYAVALAHTLVEAGWEVHLFGESWDGEPAGAVFHQMPVPRWWPRWGRMLGFALEHRRLTGSRPFDVVLGFGNTIAMNVYQSHGGVHWCSAARQLEAEPSPLLRGLKRAIGTVSLKQWMRHWIESAPFRRTPLPRIIAISQMVADDMVRSFGVARHEIDLVYNGVDSARYHPEQRERLRGPFRRTLGLAPDEVVFLFAAYDLKKKGIIPLMEATAMLKQRVGDGFRVVAAGGRPSLRQARHMARLGLKETVLFAGRIRNMAECYANSDVLVHPTYYDACSLVVIEAMASGLPCITTRANGSAGIITDGVDGFILDHPPQAAALADRMALLLAPGQRAAMSAAAAARARTCTIQQNHRELLRILDEVAGRAVISSAARNLRATQ